MPGGIDPKTSQVSARIRSESPKVSPLWSGSTIPTRDHESPSRSAGTATNSPASGPATAISKSELRSRAGERMRITAPRVPNRKNGGGAGMKKGRLTEAP